MPTLRCPKRIQQLPRVWEAKTHILSHSKKMVYVILGERMWFFQWWWSDSWTGIFFHDIRRGRLQFSVFIPVSQTIGEKHKLGLERPFSDRWDEYSVTISWHFCGFVEERTWNRYNETVFQHIIHTGQYNKIMNGTTCPIIALLQQSRTTGRSIGWTPSPHRSIVPVMRDHLWPTCFGAISTTWRDCWHNSLPCSYAAICGGVYLYSYVVNAVLSSRGPTAVNFPSCRCTNDLVFIVG